MSWFNGTNVQLVDRPRPPVVTMRTRMEALFLQTVKTKKAVRIRKDDRIHVYFGYEQARKHKLTMRSETIGPYTYLWWEAGK
jgi:hypothetical protein